MRDKGEFYQILGSIEGWSSGDLKRLTGDFDFSRYVLRFSQTSIEPGQPLLVVVRVPQAMAGFPDTLYSTPLRRTALEDYLTRRLAACMRDLQKFDDAGIARRRLSTTEPGQKILPRTAVAVDADHVEARLYALLPLDQDRLDREAAADLFFEELPRVVTQSLLYHNLTPSELEHFVASMEDTDAVRQLLPTRGWVGFVGEGSRLARAVPGDAPQPEPAPRWATDARTRVRLPLPSGAAWEGAGIPAGITVILGDECSGRRELMRALADGIYNHVPGDGREQVIAVPDSVYVAAERGRSVQGVNLSPFFPGGLPDGSPADRYSSSHAEGFLAQAASLVEAVEVGARVLLLDESDSVASFLGVDSRLASVCRTETSRFVPLSLQARRLADELGISIVVAGSAAVGAFLPVADTVLALSDYTLRDVTQEARDLALRPVERRGLPGNVHDLVDRGRMLVPSSIEPGWGRSEANIFADDVDLLVFGNDIVDLSGVPQLAEVEQTATIGEILRYVKIRYLVEPRSLREVLDLVDRDLSTEGLECLSRDLNGKLARPRRYEIAAALNRMPSLRIMREHA